MDSPTITPWRIGLMICVALLAVADWRIIRSSLSIYYTRVVTTTVGVAGPTLRDIRLNLANLDASDPIFRLREEIFANASIIAPERTGGIAGAGNAALNHAASLGTLSGTNVGTNVGGTSGGALAAPVDSYNTAAGAENAAGFLSAVAHARRLQAVGSDSASDTSSAGSAGSAVKGKEKESEKESKKKSKVVPWDSVALVYLNFRPFHTVEIDAFPYVEGELDPATLPAEVVSNFKTNYNSGSCRAATAVAVTAADGSSQRAIELANDSSSGASDSSSDSSTDRSRSGEVSGDLSSKASSESKKSSKSCPYKKSRTGSTMLWLGIGLTIMAMVLGAVGAYLDEARGWTSVAGAGACMVGAGICFGIAFGSERGKFSKILPMLELAVPVRMQGNLWVSERDSPLFSRYLDYTICMSVATLGFIALAVKAALDEKNRSPAAASNDDSLPPIDDDEAARTLLDQDLANRE